MNNSDPILFYFNKQEHAIIQKLPLSKELKKQFNNAHHGDDTYTIYLEYHDMVNLYNALTNASITLDLHQTEDFDHLYTRIEDFLGIEPETEAEITEVDSYADFEMYLREKFPDIADKVDSILDNNPLETMEDMQRALQKAAEVFNAMALDEFNGLSPEQVFYLCNVNWEDKNSAFQLNTNIPINEISKTPIIHDAHVFLNEMIEEGGSIKATATNKNLPRKFVYKMLDKFRPLPNVDERTLSISKVVNEPDIYTVHALRILFEISKLIRFQKGKYTITKKGKQFVQEEMAMDLYILLFKTYFREFNIAYFDVAKESQALQYTVAYTFYSIGQLCNEWTKLETMRHRIILPIVQEEFKNEIMDIPIARRVFDPLVQFGLLEMKKQASQHWRKDYSYKKTALFDKFFQFKL